MTLQGKGYLAFTVVSLATDVLIWCTSPLIVSLPTLKWHILPNVFLLYKALFHTDCNGFTILKNRKPYSIRLLWQFSLIHFDINAFDVGSLSQLSNSRPLYPTRCIHTISQEDRNSVLSLAASKKYLFSGSQSSQIHVRKQLTFDSSN